MEYRQITFAAAGTADLMGDQVTTGFESDFRTAPANGIYQMRIVSSAATATLRVKRATTEQVGLSPVNSGGTVGVFPTEFNSAPIEFAVLAGERVSIPLTVTAAQSVMATVDFAPV